MTNVLEGDTVAQLAHVGWGFMLVVLLQHLFSFGISLAIVAAFAFGKEAAEALGIAFWEPKQPWGSSMKDFAFFGVGILAALIHHYLPAYRLIHS